MWLQEINIPQNEDQNLSLTMKIQVDTLDRQEAVSRQSVMRTREGQDSTETFYQYKDSITEVVFQNKMNSIDTDISWDISTDGNGNCMAYLVPTAEDSDSTYTLYIQGNDLIYISSGYCLFSNFVNLNTIEGMEYVDTSQVTNMFRMFSGCSSLTNLELSNFDTSQVAQMELAFAGCSNLVSLSLEHFDTSNVSNMISMFSGCSSLTSLDLSNFDTAKLELMHGMFQNCTNLINLNLSSFDTSKVTEISSTFSGCSSLISLDIRNATFTSVTVHDLIFNSVPSNIQIIVKDSSAQAWIQDKLGSGVGTVTIAPTT